MLIPFLARLIHPQGRLTRVIADIVGEASLETPKPRSR
jgi:hypothetical protein